MREPALPAQIPTDPKASNEADSGYTLSDLALLWAEDFQRFAQIREQLLALQAWVKEQSSTHSLEK